MRDVTAMACGLAGTMQAKVADVLCPKPGGQEAQPSLLVALDRPGVVQRHDAVRTGTAQCCWRRDPLARPAA